MDIDAIEPDRDFVEVVEQAVDSCDALIAPIGKQCLTITDDAGLRRMPAIFGLSPHWSKLHACRAPQPCQMC